MSAKKTKATPAVKADPWTTPSAHALRERLFFSSTHAVYDADQVEKAMPRIEAEAISYDREQLLVALNAAGDAGAGLVSLDVVRATLLSPAHLRPAPQKAGLAYAMAREHEELMRNPAKRAAARASIAATAERLGGPLKRGIDPELGRIRMNW